MQTDPHSASIQIETKVGRQTDTHMCGHTHTHTHTHTRTFSCQCFIFENWTCSHLSQDTLTMALLKY